MEPQLIYEIIGYLASLLVAISLMMANIFRLRLLNMLGAITFCIYGILIGAIPVAAMNAFIVAINIYYLIKMYRSKEAFQLVEVDAEDAYLKVFLDFHKDELKPFFTDGKIDVQANNLYVFVLRDMVPSGLLVGKVNQEGILKVSIDFVTPAYRDFKTGFFFFHKNLKFFRNKNIHTIEAKGETKSHSAYLKKMGFEPKGTEADVFKLKL
ncbi:MAG: hypothetical protein EA412_03510 [Chitinophagaceae bacterium]|nr:MAG: hypothetical protein EA412_03510 [Chitinophagaceae bacterium]